MTCPQCRGIEAMFDERAAAKDAERYRRKGPDRSTRVLIDAMRSLGVDGATLLDIGGGVGAVQYALLEAGASRAISVDAASAYARVAEQESAARGVQARVTRYTGDFVELAPEVPEADLVTLDRVICCYHDMGALVTESAGRARRAYGVVYPRDVWWVRLGARVLNFTRWLMRSPFRIFVHPHAAVEAAIHAAGLSPNFHRKTMQWQIAVYTR